MFYVKQWVQINLIGFSFLPPSPIRLFRSADASQLICFYVSDAGIFAQMWMAKGRIKFRCN